MNAGDRFGDGAIVVALSGGPDSAAVTALAASTRLPVRCIHVDHGLPASSVMRHAAQDIAAALDLELEIVEVTARSTSETALREARYQALLAHVDDHETLVTGHTSDDQAETVLMNLLRGSGPRGLAGIPARRGRIIRPFLDVSAAELRSLAVERGLPFVDDPENISPDHLRNRIRTELIPLLEADYQAEVRTILGRTARHLSDLVTVLESVVGRVPLERSEFGVRAPVGRLAAVDEVVRRQVFRLMLASVRPPTPPSEEEVQRIEATFQGAGASEFAATEARCFVDGPWLVVGVRRACEDSPAMELCDSAAWGDFRFHIDPAAAVTVRLSKWRFTTEPRPLVVRGVRARDTIAMRGGSKSAIEAIRERGFHPHCHPVVAGADDQVVWIPGVRHAWIASPAEPAPENGYLVIVVDQDSPWAPFEP